MRKRDDFNITRRTCLKCGNEFDSRGPGNRICQLCARINAQIIIPDKVFQFQRGAKYRNGLIIR